jgi:transaldolase
MRLSPEGPVYGEGPAGGHYADKNSHACLYRARRRAESLTASPATPDTAVAHKVERKVSAEKAKSADVKRLELDEKKFRYLVNGDAMATEKTAEGIRKFPSDIGKREKFVARKIN